MFMSEFAWLGVIASAAVSTLALGSYVVMAMPYFDNLPYLNDLKRNTNLSIVIGLVLFAFTFIVNTAAELVRQRLRRRYSTL